MVIRTNYAAGDTFTHGDQNELNTAVLALQRPSTSPPLFAGKYYPGFGTGVATSALAADAFRGVRFVVGRTCTLTSLSVEVTTAGSAGSVVRPGAYLVDPATGVITALVDGGPISAETIGHKAATISTPVTLGQILVIGCASQGSPTTQPVLRTATGHDPFFGGDATQATVSAATIPGISFSAVGALPSTPTYAVSTTIPRALVMAAA